MTESINSPSDLQRSNSIHNMRIWTTLTRFGFSLEDAADSSECVATDGTLTNNILVFNMVGIYYDTKVREWSLKPRVTESRKQGVRSSNKRGAICQECNTFAEVTTPKLQCLLVGSHHGVIIKIGRLFNAASQQCINCTSLVDIFVLICPLSLLHSRLTLSICQQLEY